MVLVLGSERWQQSSGPPPYIPGTGIQLPMYSVVTMTMYLCIDIPVPGTRYQVHIIIRYVSPVIMRGGRNKIHLYRTNLVLEYHRTTDLPVHGRMKQF